MLWAVKGRCDTTPRQRTECKIPGPGWRGRGRQGAGELIALLPCKHIEAEIAFTLVFFLGVCVRRVRGGIPASLRAEINTAVPGWASIKPLGNEAYNPRAEVNTAARCAG